jgi:hypothetical protein
MIAGDHVEARRFNLGSGVDSTDTSGAGARATAWIVL